MQKPGMAPSFGSNAIVADGGSNMVAYDQVADAVGSNAIGSDAIVRELSTIM